MRDLLARPGSTTCRSRSRTATRCPPTTSPATRARSQRKRALAAEVVRLGLPLTVNVVVHRANIERIGDDGRAGAGARRSRVEIAHVQYYGWALKNRARADADARAGRARRRRRSRNCARAITAASSSTPWCPTITRAFPSPASAAGAGARSTSRRPARCCPATPRNRSPAWNSGTCAIMRSPTSGRIRRPSTRSAAPPGCRSRARAARGASIDFGGCRCQAFALTGDARATDPVCHLSPAHGWWPSLAAVARRWPYAYRR